MTGSNGYDAKYWRDRAEEARARASEMRDPEARGTMKRIAELYDSLATRLEKREAPPSDGPATG